MCRSSRLVEVFVADGPYLLSVGVGSGFEERGAWEKAAPEEGPDLALWRDSRT